MKTVLLSLFLLCTFSDVGKTTSIDNELLTLNKSQFTAGAVILGMRMGESWAADITHKVITGTVKNNSLLLDWTVGSAIRGKTLLEALPIAGKKGSQMGAVTAAILAPIVWDCSVSMYKSCKRTLRPLWDKTIPEKETPTLWDKIVAGTAVISGSMILYLFYNKLQS